MLAAAGEISAVNAGGRAFEVADDREQRRPWLEAASFAVAIEAAGMKPRRGAVRRSADAAMTQIGLGDRSANRQRGRHDAARGDLAVKRLRVARAISGRLRFVRGETQKRSRLLDHLGEGREMAGLADEVEEIAALSGRHVGPTARRASAGVRARETYLE